MKEGYKLRDIILMAILGVVFAIIYLAVCYIGDACCILLAPAGLSELGYEPIYGVWFMAATLAAFIIQKPGVALITELLAAVIENASGQFRRYQRGPDRYHPGRRRGVGLPALPL